VSVREGVQLVPDARGRSGVRPSIHSSTPSTAHSQCARFLYGVYESKGVAMCVQRVLSIITFVVLCVSPQRAAIAAERSAAPRCASVKLTVLSECERRR